MIAEGLRLMAVGMIAVFGFLALLVLVMHGAAAFFERFGDRFAEVPAQNAAVYPEEEMALALAIAAATARRQGSGGPA